jgi:hypothetical protein
MNKNKLIKNLFPGILWVAIALLFWFHVIGNPINEILLITQKTQTTTGILVDTIEHDSESDEGKVTVWDEGIYSFSVPGKGDFKTQTEAPLGELKNHQEVEYLPSNPAVNRIKGDGCKSIVEFLFRKVGIGVLFLFLLLSPGVIILRNGIKEIREARKS